MTAPSVDRTVAPILVDDHHLRSLIRSEPLPVVRGHGRNAAERILSVLADDRLRLGPRAYLDADRDRWLSQIRRSTTAGEPVRLMLMALAFKIDSPAKTDRVAMDVGEVLMMRRWTHLVARIRSVYPPGAEVHPFVEGILGRCSGQDPARVTRYADSLSSVMPLVDGDTSVLRFHDLGAITRDVEGFESAWEERAMSLAGRVARGEPVALGALRAVMESMRAAVPVPDIPEDLVLRALAQGLASADQKVSTVAAHIEATALTASYRYLAFLQLRDEHAYMDRVVPGAIKLTVSLKRGNVGSVPINRRTHTLPYHGVPVRLPSGRWSIRYRAVVRASRHRYRPIHRVGDLDAAPIAYVATR